MPADGPIEKQVVELPHLASSSDSSAVLAHSARMAENLKNYFVVDVDAHVTETAFWSEITEWIDNDVLREMASSMQRAGNKLALINHQPGMSYHFMGGRLTRGSEREEREGKAPLGSLQTLRVRRAMDNLGIDYQVLFPTPMLLLGLHPQIEMEVALGDAFNQWLVEKVLPEDDRIKALIYLPFNDPVACVKTVERFASKPGVLGFTVTSTRHRPVHANEYMRLYSLLQEVGMPLAFHAGFTWEDQSLRQLNRFLSTHAISFTHFNMIHLTNWIINGLPERFPKLKVIWVESGLAWVPFMMQRLDAEYSMRTSEAPLLRRMPSDYMRDMFYTSQPLERHNMDLTKATFKAINAGSQLLYASDWPHWDFDLPSSITSLPFLSEEEKRNILGLNAARLFNLKVPDNKLAVPSDVSRAKEHAR